MNQFDIYADSAANIPNALVKERRIKIIPFHMRVNGVEKPCYEDDVLFAETAKAFYEEMRAGAEIQTSLVNTVAFYEAALPSVQAGRDVLIFTIASGISATYKQAVEAKKMLEEEFPACKVYVLDSANASMGEGMLVLKAADLRDAGESAENAAKWIEENAYHLNSYLTVGDLKYLKKSGRISTTLAIAGTILNIKPLIRADGGNPAKLAVYGKTHGRKKALLAIAEAYKTCTTDHNQTVAICHCDCEEDAQHLAGLVREIGVKDIIIEYYDLCSGAHAGPGTVALFFFGEDRRETCVEKQHTGKLLPHRA